MTPLVQQLDPLVTQNLWSASWFRPEAVLTAGAVLLFVLDLFWRKSPRRVAYLTASALAVLAAAAGFLAVQPADALSLFNGLLANDAFASFFKWLFLAAAALVVIITAPGKDFPPARVGEFYALLVSIVLGLFMMASATDLLMMYLSIELVSLSSYVLAGFKKGDRKATEAALKYVIYGSVASGIMLFGMSYLYGLTGTTNLSQIATQVQQLSASGTAELAATRIALVVAATFVAGGLGYKIAAVPFHMWCPDVYEGAPTPFTAFLSVGPKAAGFALALRFFLSALSFPASADGLALPIGDIPWPAVIGVVSAVTMTLGNLTALLQTNLKRLLAYSSIAHAGYMLMGLAAVSDMGTQSVMVYMAIYLVMNLGAFLVVILVAQATGSESILDYRGLSRRQPFAAITFAIFLFSLTGIPPFAGFIGKWYLFVAVWERTGGPHGTWYGALLVIAALNTAIALFYYARVIRAMFIDPPYAPDAKRIVSPVSWQVVLGACAAAVLFFGIRPQAIIDWTLSSLQLFRG